MEETSMIDDIATWAKILGAAKMIWSGGREVVNWFQRPTASGPLDTFGNAEVSVICSSLFANPISGDCIPLVKHQSNGHPVAVSSGFFVTGIDDAIALASLGMALHSRKSKVTFGIDHGSTAAKNGHLILLGGPSSNLIGLDVYENHFTTSKKFFSPAQGLLVNGAEYRQGNYGYVVSMRNPWAHDFRLLWMAGLGSFGTGAAVRLVVAGLAASTIETIKGHDDFILFVRGELGPEGQVVDTKIIGHSFL
jgi:hypothetical protein